MKNTTHLHPKIKSFPKKTIPKGTYETQLPETITPKTFIYKNVFHVIVIIKEITTKIEQIEIAHKLHITFFKDLNLIISHVQIEHLNKLTQTIDQIAEELRKLFSITLCATSPKTKLKHLKKTIQNVFYQKLLPRTITQEISTSINNNLFDIIKIIKQINVKIEQVEIQHNLQITFFNDQTLIISEEQIRHINNVNHNIIQITNNLNEFFAITLNATPQK